jgi:hypothetical protein
MCDLNIRLVGIPFERNLATWSQGVFGIESQSRPPDSPSMGHGQGRRAELSLSRRAHGEQTNSVWKSSGVDLNARRAEWKHRVTEMIIILIGYFSMTEDV